MLVHIVYSPFWLRFCHLCWEIPMTTSFCDKPRRYRRVCVEESIIQIQKVKISQSSYKKRKKEEVLLTRALESPWRGDLALARVILNLLYSFQSANPTLWEPQKRSQTFPLTPRLCQHMPDPAGPLYYRLRVQTAVNSLCQDPYKCDKHTAF